MLYIKRDTNGTIKSIYQGQGDEGGEAVCLSDEEVIRFLQDSGDEDSIARVLSLSDSSIVRVLEDLIDLLIKKQVVLLTDLPLAAQEKIRSRKRMRQGLSGDDIMVNDII